MTITPAQRALLERIVGDKLVCERPPYWDWTCRGAKAHMFTARRLVEKKLVQPIAGRTNEWHISAAGLAALQENDR